MNIATLSTTTGDPVIDRALQALSEGGFSFEVVARCPAECSSCDATLPHAA